MANLGKVVLNTAIIFASSLCFAESPEWILKTNCSLKRSKIVQVNQDLGLVKIDAGLQSNFRNGLVCEIRKEEDENSAVKVVIIKSTKDSAVAMVTSDGEISTGDAVYIIPAN